MGKKWDKPSAALVEAVYAEQVSRKALLPVERPFVVFVAGVAGSGKSYCLEAVKTGLTFNVFTLQPDDYRKLHPRLGQLIEKHGRDNAHKHTGSFANYMVIALREMAVKTRLNVVYETTFNNIETAKTLITHFQTNGYRVVVLTLPVNVAQSIERNESRYQTKREDLHTLPRKVSLQDIEHMAENFVAHVAQIEALGVSVVRVLAQDNARDVLREVMGRLLPDC